MRRIVLDTETTGLEPAEGHRIIEVACLELFDRRATGRHFHRYLNPERAVDIAATQVHGMTVEDLADKPRFADIAVEFLEYIRGAELIIHNAAFDVGFIDAELARLGPEYGRLRDHATILDTLALAREMYPGQRNSLDALCKRYSVDNSHRELHGALLDAQILLDVYLAMTGGQTALVLGEVTELHVSVAYEPAAAARPRGVLRVVRASNDELAAHERILQVIDKMSGGKTVWRREDAREQMPVAVPA
jgi:DNA polymerase-3 subunit epsilon